MPDCNGIKLKTLNPDCNRLAVKSTVQTSWNPTYKTRLLARPKEYEIGFDRDELIVIGFQDGSGHAYFDVIPLGAQVGTIISQKSTRDTKVLRVGTRYRFDLSPGEQIVFRSSAIVHPTRGNKTLGF
jgi:hypothetical protein